MVSENRYSFVINTQANLHIVTLSYSTFILFPESFKTDKTCTVQQHSFTTAAHRNKTGKTKEQLTPLIFSFSHVVISRQFICLLTTLLLSCYMYGDRRVNSYKEMLALRPSSVTESTVIFHFHSLFGIM